MASFFSGCMDSIDKKKGIQGLMTPENETNTETEKVEVDYENL